MNNRALVLKAGRDKSIRNFHPWIFSGAVEHFAEVEDGELVAILSCDEDLVGHGYVNRNSSIYCRVLSFGPEEPLVALDQHLEKALDFREHLFKNSSTNAYRLINSEGDNIPGLIVDSYADVLVLQTGTLGIEKLKSKLVERLVERLKPRAIIEKSNLPSRAEEGLKDSEGLIYGENITRVEIQEYAQRFLIDFVGSQKTGFFLDQREMRLQIGELCGRKPGARVLNCFSFSGGFSVYAATAGAARVDSVDVSQAAIRLAEENFRINGLDPEVHGFICADVFDHLRNLKQAYDLIILDPPAFAKKRAHKDQACRGYKEINRLAFANAKSGGMVLSCSCSYHVEEALFRQVVFQAAREANREVSIVQKHRLAMDHPINIYHPEGDYLKGFVLYVR